jgi:hypothetical protein
VILVENAYQLQALETYIDGKMRRYNLLFAVNGGAFAIAKLFSDPAAQALVGGLSLPHLAVGAIIFTLVMTLDIWRWGQTMRQQFLGNQLAFTILGKGILVLLSSLLIAGWGLAAFG